MNCKIYKRPPPTPQSNHTNIEQHLTQFLFFSWLGQLMYSIVAALDWNYNVNRAGKVSKDGKQLYKSKVLILIRILNSSCTI